MLYIGENLRTMRKSKDLTQEDVAGILGVTPQTVSKWERGDTYPDITMLPSLANLFNTSIDTLIGMDRINDAERKRELFRQGHEHIKERNIEAAIDLYTAALKEYSQDEGIMSDLAMALALSGDQSRISKAKELCTRVLAGSAGSKVHHTTRAALCFIYLKAGNREMAEKTARDLPHVWESRETVQVEIAMNPDASAIDTYLRYIAIGEI
ncbi:MAG: helix-turn-helix domain-containing protein [Symbiobacteriaceae bacterium]|nr:helix-turn-helix domain-containing protein [Symbiobacteriaceae bacterium]